MRLAALAAVIVLFASPVSAQVVTDQPVGRPAAPQRPVASTLITAIDANGLAAALRSADLAGEVKVEGRVTTVVGRAGDIPFQAFLGACNPAGERCADIELYAGFTGGQRMPLERINGWNNRTRFARAFLVQSGDPALQMDISLEGGLSPESLRLHLETWGAALETYAAFLASRPGTAPRAPAGQPRR